MVAGYAVLLLLTLERSLVSDSWLALVAGREIAEDGVPTRDGLATWTAGREWIDQQWLAQFASYALYRGAGLGAVAIAGAAVAAGALGLGLAAARRNGASGVSAALVAVVSAPALLPFAAVRPQTLAYPLFVALFVVLEGARLQPSRRVLLAIPILLLWANVHGSALLGACIVTLWTLLAVRSNLRAVVRLSALAGASWLCLLATPSGLSVAGYYGRILTSQAFGEVVSEWMPASFPAQLPFFLLCGLAAVVVLTPRPRYSLFARAVVVAAAGAGFVAVRHTVWLPLVLVVLAPAALDELWRPRGAKRHPRVNVPLVGAATVAVATLVGVAAARPDSFYERPLEPAASRATADALQRAGGPVFADPEFADWLLWRRPELKGRVAFDARFELLSDAELRRLGAFFRRSGPQWRSAVDCCAVLVLRSEHRTTAVLSREPGTRVAYRDGTTTVLVRRSPSEEAST